MKTTYRRFMALLCAVAVVSIVSLPEVVRGQGYMAVYNGLGPDTVSQSFVNDTIYALQNGLSSYGSWNSIPNGSSLNITNIFVSNGIGNDLYSALVITNSTPFTLGQIQFSAISPLFSFSGTFGGNGLSYSSQGIGINGQNTYNSGNANTPVYAIYVIGFGYSMDTTGLTTQQAINNMAKYCPFENTITYSLGSLSEQSKINYITTSVPEPNTLTIAVVGLALTMFSVLRKKYIHSHYKTMPSFSLRRRFFMQCFSST